jgi:hypothetical protein
MEAKEDLSSPKRRLKEALAKDTKYGEDQLCHMLAQQLVAGAILTGRQTVSEDMALRQSLEEKVSVVHK